MSTHILSVAASIFCGLVCSLVLLYLRSLSKLIETQNTRLDKQDTRIAVIEKDIKDAAKNKDKCRQDFVDKVDYIREINKLETTMTEQLKVLCELKGAMTVIEQMPKICGNIASEVVNQMQKQGGK